MPPSALAIRSGPQGPQGALTVNTLTLMVGGGWPSDVDGSADAVKVTFATNGISVWLSDFGASSQEYFEWTVPMPTNWDGGVFIPKSFKWIADTSDTDSVVWGVQARSWGDGESADQSWGTAQEIVDANNGQNLWNFSGDASGVTPAGTPAGGETVQFRAYRDPTNGSDDLGAIAKLNAVVLEFGVE